MDGSGTHKIKSNEDKKKKKTNKPAEPQEWLNSRDAFYFTHYFKPTSKQQPRVDTVSIRVLLQR